MATQYRSEFQKGFIPPFQTQPNAPGAQHKLDPAPLDDITADGKPYKAAGKLQGRTALITGADSGIGRATAILFALEGADLTLAYLPQEEKDVRAVELIIRNKAPASKLNLVAVDLRTEAACVNLIEQHMKTFGILDTLILNHATQQAVEHLADLSSEQWHNVFDTNIHSFFYLTKAALPRLPAGSSIVMNASINQAVGHPELLDYTATKGAMIAFMRGLSNQIVGDKGIRVNAVAPGPVWTPLIPATMTEDSIKKFGASVPMERAGQPVEIATVFVFLASADSSFISGQIIHANGGVVIN